MNIKMKKIIAVILLLSTLLLAVACSSGKVDVTGVNIVVVNYDFEGTKVNANVTDSSAAIVINNVNGKKITKDAPDGAEYNDGIYFEINKIRFYIDVNGGNFLKVDDRGYIEIEDFKLDAMAQVFNQYGVSVIR